MNISFALGWFGFGNNHIRGVFAIKRRFQTICKDQQVLNPTPLNPNPCNMPQAKTEIVLQKLHCNIRFYAVQMSFIPKVALQQAKNCTPLAEKGCSVRASADRCSDQPGGRGICATSSAIHMISGSCLFPNQRTTREDPQKCWIDRESQKQDR